MQFVSAVQRQQLLMLPRRMLLLMPRCLLLLMPCRRPCLPQARSVESTSKNKMENDAIVVAING